MELEVKFVFTADEAGLEFSRNLSGLFVNLVAGEKPVSIGETAFVSETKQELKKMENEQGERPWEEEKAAPIEEDPLKYEEPKKVYTKEQVREAGAAFIEKNGKVAFKTILDKYEVAKLSQLDESRFDDIMKELGV